MIFKSGRYSATWDTWMYYHGGTFYLYYLITGKSPGEGFGVATSRDGVHFKDHGMVLHASEKMVFYLGTGSVWKDPTCPGHFLCNYSEWRLDKEGKQRQNILFAWSEDLIHWNKYGDGEMFSIDERYYERYGRWDCINAIPRKEGGYWGIWTATPITLENGGVGIGYSDDGIHWAALPPNDVTPVVYEAGSFAQYNGRVYFMFGKDGMFGYTADDLESEIVVQKKNGQLLKPCHSYFSRYFETPEGLLVNHHAMNGAMTETERPVTYLALLKRFTVDGEGIQRWMYWHGNDALRGSPIESTRNVDFRKGAIFETDMAASQCPQTINLEVDGCEYGIEIAADGAVHFHAEAANEEWQREHGADREMDFGERLFIRIFARAGMLELYINDYFMECWTMGCPDGGSIRIKDSPAGTKCWEMSL